MSKVDDARRKLSEARERVADLNRNRQEHQQRIEELRGRRERAEQEAEAASWVPDDATGGGATATATKTAERLEQMEEELAELEGAHERAEEAVEEAEAELIEAIEGRVPGVAEDAIAGTRRIFDAYSALGEEPGNLERFAGLLEARTDVREALDEVRRLRTFMPDSAGGFEKARRLRLALKRELDREVSPATVFGFEWAEKISALQGREHLAGPLAEAGIPPQPVPSPFGRAPAGNAREAVRDNKLPLTAPKI